MQWTCDRRRADCYAHGAGYPTEKENVEAVIGDAIRISLEFNNGQETLIVVNPRRIAVIIDKPAHRGAVNPVEFIDQVIKSSMKTRLRPCWRPRQASST
jgi:hypothetical protein